ncbi:Condensin complex subunit 2 [Psilocybe cubensis]|uniref:Condensin complex subunit 2 n=2 Tax=Psilocybe cubensis TaxID=181762 RepID=A0A8H7XVA0_PSICU|nr:Condensin complex subunit 2 [Psilocybe cubensis]KAH9479636.1 Condensin complex subunit 2 [Psilocybe cubensis]
MAPARRARSPSAAQPNYADTTDEDSEQETPRPHKSLLKKRLSEVYHPDNDGASGSDQSNRPPLRAVNINDDAAEKRRRRKSTKHAVIDSSVLAGPSSETMQTQEVPEPARGGKQKTLQSITPLSINVDMDVMSSNFEEWMKMATDNKINASNSWNFALIDYFHDMSLLRNNDDNSINFQRASYTLDGCVKIWTSRVDSVGTETGKLLSNLETGGKLDEGDDGDNSDNPDGDGTQAKKRKANRGTGATLAKDPASLKNKKPDLEFAVDPLFKKTCADFDEGGASGLLLNHLSLGIGSEGCMRVIFDASDPMGKVEEEDIIEEPEDEIDLTFLRKHFLPDLSVLEDKAISHSLSEFAFAKGPINLNDMTYLNNAVLDNDDDDESNDQNFGTNMDGVGGNEPPVEDFFIGADAVNDDFGGDMGDDYGGDNGSNNGSVGPIGDAEQTAAGPMGIVPFDPRYQPNTRELTLAMNADGGAFDYFDPNLLKNWAGPEHWKLRKNIRKPEAEAGAAKPNKRQKKEAVKIDFTTPSAKDAKEIAKDLFAPVTGKGASINLPGTGTTAGKKGKKKKEKRDDHRLPDDMHFSDQQLVSLFLKPKFRLQMRGTSKRGNVAEGEIDENFWAQAAANQAANRDYDPDADESAPAPFNTQFFHEDDFGGGFDDGFDADVGGMADEDAGEQDLLAATQGQTRRVKPQAVNYTKRAKRVDVRKLKENIWKGLDIVVAKKKPRVREEDGMDVDPEDEEGQTGLTDPNDSRQFSQVISGLQQSYPPDKMEEISTSFCFICLLHLANEQGLKLESTAQDKPTVNEPVQEESDESKIGNIWDIKIYRDPNATQSA